MSNEDLMNKIESVIRGGSATTVVINRSYDNSMNKGTKNNRNPYLGRVRITKVYSGYALGCNYATQVANTATRVSGDTVKAEDVQLKRVWHRPIQGHENWFVCRRSDGGGCYLHLGRNEKQIGHKIVTEYYLDGRPATDEEIDLIKSWDKGQSSKSQSSTQTELGIGKENEVKFLAPDVETIVAIKQGDKLLTFGGGVSVTEMELIEKVEKEVNTYAV